MYFCDNSAKMHRDMNPPNSPLVHLGCAAGVALAGVSAGFAGASVDLAAWLSAHWYIAPLGMLAALAAAYLLEHALTPGSQTGDGGYRWNLARSSKD